MHWSWIVLTRMAELVVLDIQPVDWNRLAPVDLRPIAMDLQAQ
jgi:hypothetical protein